MPSSTMFSDMDKNILEKMKNLNSHYVSSLEKFDGDVEEFSDDNDDIEGFDDDDVEGFDDDDVEGFDDDDVEGFDDDDNDDIEGFDDDDVEGFSDDNNDIEGFDDDDDEFSNIEGMKSSKKKSSKKKSSKKKSSKNKSSKNKSKNIFKKPKKPKKNKKKKKKKKKTKPIPKFDPIKYLITKFGGTSKDASIFKEILTILFTAFLAFLVAHNWYSNFLINPIYDRLESKLSAIKENDLTNAIFKYFVEIVKTIDEFIMSKIHKNIAEMTETSSFFGRRFVFYTILSFSFGVVSYFFKQVTILYDFTLKKLNELILIKKNDSKQLKKYFSDLLTSFLKQFTVNPVITSIVTIMYVIFFVSAAIKENSSSFFPAAIAQPTAVMLIWYIVKFAVLFAPTVMLSSTMLTIYFFYYSVIKNGGKDFYSLFKENIEHMNEKKVVFDNNSTNSFWSKIINNIESFFKVINLNFHEIFFFSTIMKLFPYILSFPSFILKFSFGAASIMYIYKLITSVLTKSKVGTETIENVGKGLDEFQEIITQIPVAKEKTKYSNMFDRIYHGYKDKNDTTTKTA
jgi:hypothetical protein